MVRSRPRGSRSTANLTRAVEAFNRKHPVGSEIRVWPGVVGVGPGTVVTIVEPGARVLSGHTAVVQVSGGHGCIALSHVKPMPLAARAGGGGASMRLTPAQRRVLAKVTQHGAVGIAGGFSGGRAPMRTDQLPAQADRRGVIERLLAKRLLSPGPAFNSYVRRPAPAAAP